MCGSTPNRNIFVILFEIAPGNIIILKDPESCSDFDVEKLLYYSQYACGNGRDLIIKLDIEGFISLKRKKYHVFTFVMLDKKLNLIDKI